MQSIHNTPNINFSKMGSRPLSLLLRKWRNCARQINNLETLATFMLRGAPKAHVACHENGVLCSAGLSILRDARGNPGERKIGFD
jgi:hypothetical protein